MGIREQWARSRAITAQTWSVLEGNRAMYRFPVLGVVMALVPVVVLMGPGAVLIAAETLWGLGIALLVVGAYLAVLAVTVRMAGLVAAADVALRGGTVDTAAAMSAARSRLGALAGWAAIQTLVGWILSLIRGSGDDNVAVAVVRMVLAGLLAATWNLVTLFVLPAIVLERTGAISGLKRSAALFRERWGRQIAGEVRISVRVALWYILPGVALALGGLVVAVALETVAMRSLGVAMIVIGVALVIVGMVIQATARTVFGVALFRYAETGTAIGPFSDDDLAGSVRAKD